MCVMFIALSKYLINQRQQSASPIDDVQILSEKCSTLNFLKYEVVCAAMPVLRSAAPCTCTNRDVPSVYDCRY